MEEHSNCLICGCLTAAANGHSNSITTKDQFHRHLYVIFILRSILDLPVDQLASHLKNNWNIQDWISICDNCDVLVVQCRGFYDQLVKISKMYKSCQRDIIRIVKETSGRYHSLAKNQLQEQEKENTRFVEDIHNFVLKHDYEQLMNPYPLGKPRSRRCVDEVQNATTERNGRNLASHSIIKSEPGSDCKYNDTICTEQSENWTPDDGGCNNDISMNAPHTFSDNDNVVQPENLDRGGKRTRRKRIRFRRGIKKGDKVFSCPLCTYKKPINYDTETTALLICFHLDKCFKIYKEKNNTGEEMPELKCGFCPIYSCGMSDVFLFVNHLVSCTREPTTAPLMLQQRTFHCNICPDTKGYAERYLKFDRFLRHYNHHRFLTYECIDCGHLSSTTDQFRSHWTRNHKDLYGLLVDPNSRVKKLESPSCPTIPWWCPHCGVMFKEETERDEHLQSAHPPPPLDFAEQVLMRNEKCQFCEKLYYCPAELKLHQTTAHTLDTIQFHPCDQCSEEFVQKTQLLLHRRRNHKLDLLKCCVCAKEFVTQYSLHEHLKIHQKTGQKDVTTTESSLKCQICNREYMSKRTFQIHMAVVHKQSLALDYACQVCGKACVSQKRLLKHLSCCHTVAPTPVPVKLVCPVERCGKLFAYQTSLKDHVAGHDKKIAFTCSYCAKGFYLEKALKAHEKLVHGEITKQFQCDHCPYKTKLKIYLKLHQRRCHSPEGVNPKRKTFLTCDLCPRRCLSYKNLEKHKRRKHKIGLVKRRQGQATTDHDNESLKKEFKCQICGMILKSQNGLRQHQRKTLRCKQLYMSKEEATVVCHVCGGRYSNKAILDKHVREVHHGMRPTYTVKVTCEHCGRGFYGMNQYKQHLAAVHQTGEYYDNKEQFKCPEEGCGKILFFDTSRRRHIKLHRDMKMQVQFKCDQCGKAFSSVRYRYMHVRTVHLGHKYKKKPKAK